MLIRKELRITTFHRDLSLTKITWSPVKGHVAKYKVVFYYEYSEKWM